MDIGVVVCGGLGELLTHVRNGHSWRQDRYASAIAHEDGIHFEIDDDLDLKDTAAIIWVLAEDLLRGVQRLGLDVVTLLAVRPKLDTARMRTFKVLAHADEVVKEVLRIKIRVLTESYALSWRDTHNAIQRQVKQAHFVIGATEQEPAIAKLLEQIRVQHIFNWASLVERLIDDVLDTMMGNVVIERTKQLKSSQIRYTVVVDNRVALLARDR